MMGYPVRNMSNGRLIMTQRNRQRELNFILRRME
jgi:hypothetical protein